MATRIRAVEIVTWVMEDWVRKVVVEIQDMKMKVVADTDMDAALHLTGMMKDKAETTEAAGV
jgi:hypothetical protein